MPRVEIAFVVPVFNRWDLAEPLLRALRETTRHLKSRVIVAVDDASDADTGTKLASLGDPLEIIRNESNLGFGRSVNHAISRLDARLVVLVNSDLVLTPGWIEPMLAAMESHPSAFAIGNVQRSPEDGLLDHAGIVFGHGGYPLHFRAGMEFVTRKPTREFPAVTAACMLFRRDRFLALGGFDERYRNGFEDIDLCLRARMRGWPSYVANNSKVGHHVAASPGRLDLERENARLFLERWRMLTLQWEHDWAERLALEHTGDSGGRLPIHSGPTTARSHGDQRPAGPTRVLVDLARLMPGGANGGIKVLLQEVFSKSRAIANGRLHFLFLLPDCLRDEIDRFAGDVDEVWILPDSASVPRGPPFADKRVHWLSSVSGLLARELQADVLYCPLGVSDFLSVDLPVVTVVVDLLHREYPGSLPGADVSVRESWIDRMFAASFRIQCGSNWVATRARELYHSHVDQVFFVHIAVHDRLPAPTRTNAGSRHFLYPANAWPHKNHDTLLVAYRIYQRAAGEDAWPLVLTGHHDEAMARVEARATALGLSSHVRFRGFVSEEAFANEWASTGALIFPSVYEGFGIPVLEAMHRGIPVVAGKLASIPEVAGDACLFTDVRDPCALAGAMRRIQVDGQLREQLAIAGRRRAASFSFRAEAKKLVDALIAAHHAFESGGVTWRWPSP